MDCGVVMLQECARAELDAALAGPLAEHDHVYCGVVPAAQTFKGSVPMDWGLAIA
eukprot:COSAG05_NODE_6644_length_926_cov_2.642080_2_plen_55_part_00